MIDASQKFETFLSHRGEEMGSIRGRVRVHVPKDRRTTRKKIYGGSSKNILSFITALLALSLPTKSPPITAFANSAATLTLLPLYGSSMTTLAWLYTLAGIYRPLPIFGSWLADPGQMHPETRKQDIWVICHQVRHNKHTHWPFACMQPTDFEEMCLITKLDFHFL